MKLKNKFNLLLVIVIAITSFSACQYVDFKNYKDIQVDDSEHIDLEGISTIEISSVSSDIIIIIEDRDDIQASYTGNISISEPEQRPYLEVAATNRKAQVWIEYPSNNIMVNNNNALLTVYIPKSYEEAIDISSVSGDIRMKDAILLDLSCNNVSGDIFMDTLNIRKSDFSTVSGDIELSEFIGEILSLNTVSGDSSIEIPNNYDLDLESSTVSGDIHSRDSHSENHTQEISINASSISGDIDITRFDN